MVDIVEGWGAQRAPSSYELVPWDVRELFVVHHTTGSTLGHSDPEQWLRNIDHYHGPDGGHGSINLGFGYNLAMSWGDKPKLYMGRGLDRLGAHASGFNTVGVGIALLGDYREGRDELTDAMKALLREAWLYVCDLAGHALTPVGHGDVGATACPGGQAQTYVDAGLPRVGGSGGGGRVDWRKEIVNGMDVVNLAGVTNRSSTFVRGSNVGRLQTWLANAGFPPANSFNSRGVPDRVGGPATKVALGRFQEQHATGRPSSPRTADHVAGSATWGKLASV